LIFLFLKQFLPKKATEYSTRVKNSSISVHINPKRASARLMIVQANKNISRKSSTFQLLRILKQVEAYLKENNIKKISTGPTIIPPSLAKRAGYKLVKTNWGLSKANVYEKEL